MKVLLALLFVPLLAQAQQEDYKLLGASVRTRPDYDGSASRTVDLTPIVRYYGRPLFARTTQGMFEGGARMYYGSTQAGVQIAYEAGRDEAFGLPKVSVGASYGVHVENDFKIGPVPGDVLLRLRKHFDSDRGWQADLRANLGVYGEHGTLAGIFAQATWASAKSMQSFYGIDDSGLLFASLGAYVSHDIGKTWLLLASAEVRRLSNDAMASPIVEKRTGTYATLGGAYRF
jgi:outer membrane scaffolding protein for murein synthesis (MipA/OmpV family)